MIFGLCLTFVLKNSNVRHLASGECEKEGICDYCITGMSSAEASTKTDGPYWKGSGDSGTCVSCSDAGLNKPFFNVMTNECVIACPTGTEPE